MDDISKVTHELLQFQILIKIYHWQTRSYPRHVASDELHSSLSKNIDLIVESMQGELSKRIKFTPSCVLNLTNMNDKSIVVLLKTFKTWMEKDFTKLATSGHLLNIRDEIITDITKALYLFSLE